MTKRLSVLLLIVACILSCRGQTGSETAINTMVDSKFRTTSVATLQSLIDKKYFDIAAIPKINTALGAALAHGDYSRDKTANDFASALTTTLYSASHDKHLFVTASAESQSGSS